jgi:acetolactate synthase-1/2/3 large subunit
VPAPRVAEVAEALRRAGERAVILIGSGGLTADGKRAVARAAAATGAAVLASAPGAVHDRGRHLPAFRQLPYFPDQARSALAEAELVVLAGARDPVTFFGYPDVPSRVAPEGARVSTLASPAEDVAGALAALCEELGASADDPLAAARFAPPDRPERAATGPLDPGSLGRTVAALLPDDAVLVIEAVTAAWGFEAAANGAVPHTALLATAGGAIGQGLPAAVGAAVARPGAKVVALQADGSAAYTLQALWTMARESLDVVVVLCSNRRYAILQVELGRAGMVEPGPASAGLTALDRPAIGWSHLAEGFGVPASVADDAAGFGAALERALATPGPHLIEARL